MRRCLPFLVALAAALVLPLRAFAAPPVVTAQAAPASGQAPLAVTLTATGDAAAYHWDLGDGTSADGAAVQHTYAAGAWTATVTATGADGETAQATVRVTASAVTLRAPRLVTYGRAALFRGRVVPGGAGIRVTIAAGGHTVAHVTTKRDGTFRVRARVRAPGPYQAAAAGAVSSGAPLVVRPLVSATLVGSGVVGRPLSVRVALTPAKAGAVRIRIWRNGRQTLLRTGRSGTRIRLGTGAAASYRIRVEAVPAAGYARAARQLETVVHSPTLTLGSRGPSVHALEQRLHELHYALSTVDSYFGSDTSDAVFAFPKVNGLARTGAVDAAVWSRLATADVPKARFGGDRIEVDKTRQVLFVVRGGRVTLVVDVSTGATGNTPLGHWRVYSKVPGYNAKLMYFSSFFVGGFAIHGYHDVPAYPASHGCVRVPLWVAVRLYALATYGSEVDIYL